MSNSNIYPKETLTTSQRGKKEVRILKDRGEYTAYNYKDLESKQIDKKWSLVLKSNNGSVKQYFIIPTVSETKSIMIEGKDSKEKITNKKLWYEKEGKGEIVEI